MSRFVCKYDEHNNCIDVEILRENALPLQMLGKGGALRELSILPKSLAEDDITEHLFVFLGFGLGFAYAEFVKQYPKAIVAVVDKEKDIFDALNHQIPNDVLVLHDDIENALIKLSKWQNLHNGKPFYPIINPFYQRLDRDFYADLKQKLQASQQFDFWAKVRFPKFKNHKTKLLLIYSNYFLLGEVERACAELDVEFRQLSIENHEVGTQEFVELLLREVVSFRPDAILTLNHSGLDHEGVLMDLIEKLQMPLISWFLDNPHLILTESNKHNSKFLHIFTWDLDNLASLKAEGMENVYYLPLGTDSIRFNPKNINKAVPKTWKNNVSFVGNSMLYKVESSFTKSGLNQAENSSGLWKTFLELSEDFIYSPLQSVDDFFRTQTTTDKILFYEQYKKLQPAEKLALATGITREATRLYRQNCLENLFDHQPLLVGDDGWKTIFKDEKRKWFWHDAINYYSELPFFYPHSKINFNCTSMQMKNASNQRVLDVPATNSFIITDFREQMQPMFEIGKEIICFTEQAEIPELVKYYLAHESERKKISEAGYKRVISCHTWKHRLLEIIKTLKEKFSN